MALKHCKIIDLKEVADKRGKLIVIEGKKHVPFEIRRVFYIYDVPSGKVRGGHAHKRLEELLIAVHGSFDAIVDDGHRTKSFHLNRRDRGLYVPPLTWRVLENFSPESVCLVLASDHYRKSDDVEDRGKFDEMVERSANTT